MKYYFAFLAIVAVNVVHNPGVYRPALVSLGADVTGMQGDDTAGIC